MLGAAGAPVLRYPGCRQLMSAAASFAILTAQSSTGTAQGASGAGTAPAAGDGFTDALAALMSAIDGDGQDATGFGAGAGDAAAAAGAGPDERGLPASGGPAGAAKSLGAVSLGALAGILAAATDSKATVGSQAGN